MIFLPFNSARLVLPNRLVMAPMTTYSSYESGEIHPEEVEFLRNRGAAGFAIVMTAACFVHPSGKAFDGQWGCETDDRMSSLELAAAAIAEGGAAPVLQIHHGGRQCPGRLCGGQPWSASAIPSERINAETPRAMTEAEIEEIIESYGQAARRAREAGYRGVEIHGANTYLIQQFVSPHSNRRDDAWGDPFKFALELTKRVLEEARDDFWVGYRFSPEETEVPGIRLPLTLRLVDQLADLPLAWLHVSLGSFSQSSLVGDYHEITLNLIANAIGKRVPLIGVGGINSRELGNRALSLGADLVAFGRVAITDPQFITKMAKEQTPTLTYPAEGGVQRLTVPSGLDRKILNAPGWFTVG
jgi:2,4-dienoyl-CoA reductase-like NADH-dependent reductase (Old Yellow Enzyme family)